MVEKVKISVGLQVIFVPTHANNDIHHKDCEHGVVHQLQDENNVFVRYVKNGILQETSQRTPIRLLYWDGK